MKTTLIIFIFTLLRLGIPFSVVLLIGELVRRNSRESRV
jgi:hypothetical protein